MKNNMLILALFSTTIAHGMETISLLSSTDSPLSLIYNGTKINLIKGSINHPDNPISIIVVGNHQHKLLQKKSKSLQNIGHIYYDKSLPRSCHAINNQIMRVEEPSIYNSIHDEIKKTNAEFMDDSVYKVRRVDPNKESWHYFFTFKGDEAIQKALQDLALCYKKCLTEGQKIVQYSKDNSSIAFPTLSTNISLPIDKTAPISIATVFDFIQDHPKTYDAIYFFVEEQSDFMLYKKLLMEYYKPIKAICLLRWTHENEHDFLSILPRKTIDYIALLMLSHEETNIFDLP